VKFIYRGGGGGKQEMSRKWHLRSLIFKAPKQDVSMVEVDSVITLIDDRAFENWRSLKSITIPSTITAIGDYAFVGCSSLTTVNFPPSITSIGDGIFCGCSSLTTIVLPTSITTIGNLTFHNCKALTTVTLPPNITTIGLGTFSDCTSLISVHFKADPSYISISMFMGCGKLTTVKAPSFSITAFNENPEGFREVLVEAGFSPLNHNLRRILVGGGPASAVYPKLYRDETMSRDRYYNVRLWARTRSGKDGRLPLCTAAARSLEWEIVGQIFKVNMPAILEMDTITGLPLFMLAAVGEGSDLEAVYRLLREYPTAIAHA